MNWVIVLVIVLSGIAIVLGLLLSSSGSTAGLTALRGQDLELFKKTKDRGLVKILQIIMLIILLLLTVLVVLNSILGWSVSLPAPPAPPAGGEGGGDDIIDQIPSAFHILDAKFW